MEQIDPAIADIRGLGLELVRAFTHAQDAIDMVVRRYFEKQTPGLLFWLKHRGVLDRIDDDNRPKLLLGVSTELKTDAELSNFATVFAKAKEMRNRLANSARIDVLDGDRLNVYRRAHISQSVPDEAPKVVSRLGLTKRIRDCGWLADQADYVGVQAFSAKVVHQGQVYEMVRPAAHPDDWDGVKMRLVGPYTC